MTGYEAPAYYRVTHQTDTPLAPDSCTEGRIFLTEERLICGAGEAGQGGIAAAMDEYAGSTVRTLLGNTKDFQTFDRAAAAQREATVDVPLSAVTSVDAVVWDLREPKAGNVTDQMAIAGGGVRKGTNDTYGIRVEATTLEGTLVVQLGEGWRNHGSGKNRHEALARAIAALAGETDGEVEAANEADTTVAATKSATETATESEATSAEIDRSETQQQTLGQEPGNLTLGILILGTLVPAIFALSPFIGSRSGLPVYVTVATTAIYTAISQWLSALVIYGLATEAVFSPNFYLISPWAILLTNMAVYMGFVIDVIHVRQQTSWTPRLRYYLPGLFVAWFITIPVYLYRRKRISNQIRG